MYVALPTPTGRLTIFREMTRDKCPATQNRTVGEVPDATSQHVGQRQISAFFDDLMKLLRRNRPTTFSRGRSATK